MQTDATLLQAAALVEFGVGEHGLKQRVIDHLCEFGKRHVGHGVLPTAGKVRSEYYYSVLGGDTETSVIDSGCRGQRAR
jgi:hypothetical protein